jgi:general secretion pathway protein G
MADRKKALTAAASPPALPGARLPSPTLAARGKRGASGFTLIELGMAVAIVALLAAIAIPAYQGHVFRVRVAEATSDIKQIEREIERFKTRSGGLPASLADLDLEANEDPWGNPYQYLSFAGLTGSGAVRKDHNLVPINTDYDLYSLGPDGQSKLPLTAKVSQDDIVRASNGRFVGLAREY